MKTSRRFRGATAFTAALILTCSSLSSAAAVRVPTQRPASNVAATAEAPEYRPTDPCGTTSWRCPDLRNSTAAYGYYVGHDEPVVEFHSDTPGSGGNHRYQVKLPKDPRRQPDGKNGVSWNFQLHPAFWFGMVLCDPESFPEYTKTCKPNSDTNIKTSADPNSPNFVGKQAGSAYMELQFYPPGWVTSCDPKRWCAAMTVTGLSLDGGNQSNNAECDATAGVEYQSFAFLTRSGRSQAPANPIALATDPAGTGFTADPKKALFMGSGDDLTLTITDTPAGLKTQVDDHTTGRTGSMTASIANGFGSPKYQPNAAHCANRPLAYHPMFSTSTTETFSNWTAHQYNVAFADEIGHFDYCSNVTAEFDPNGGCSGTEGGNGDVRPSDADDAYCAVGDADEGQVPIGGCTAANAGFDGTSYRLAWPDGNTALHPTPIRFTSPRFGPNFTKRYERAAFESDMPLLEAIFATTSTCDLHTGDGCTILPFTDEGEPAEFYPFFSIHQDDSHCHWLFGNDVPGETTRDFGGIDQYGSLFPLAFQVDYHEAVVRYFDFRRVIRNPC
jgi:hypothetical protein